MSKRSKARQRTTRQTACRSDAQPMKSSEHGSVAPALPSGVDAVLKNIRYDKARARVRLEGTIHVPTADEWAREIDSSFDPWTASPERIEAYSEGLACPEVCAWYAARGLLADRDRIEGDGEVLLHAIGRLMAYRLRPPEWMATAYMRRMDRFNALETATLDEAFDHVPPTERTLKNWRKNRALRPKVHRALIAALVANPERPIDIELYEEIGSQFGIGKTLCRELSDAEVKQHGRQGLVDLKAILQQRKASSGQIEASAVLPTSP